HDHVDRVAHQRQQQYADQEGGRYRQADKKRGAARKGIQNHDEHQDDGNHHMVLQVTEQLLDKNRLVLRVGDFHPFGRRLDELVGDRLHAFDRVDEIGADALLHLDGDGRLAVQPGDGFSIGKGGTDSRDVLGPDDGVGRGNDGQVGDIFRRLYQRRHLDGVFAFRAFYIAGGYQAVRSAHSLDELVDPDAIGRQLHRIDYDLAQVVALSLKISLQNARHFLYAIAQFARGSSQHALGNMAGQGDDHDGEFGNVDFGDG